METKPHVAKLFQMAPMKTSHTCLKMEHLNSGGTHCNDFFLSIFKMARLMKRKMALGLTLL
jgi:hypothetical protein